MDPHDLAPRSATVVALDDDRDLVFEANDARSGDRQPQGARELETEVLVVGMAIEIDHAGLEDVGRGNGARGDAPTLAVEEQGRLRLGSGEAELAAVGGAAPHGGVASKRAQTLGDARLVEPVDRASAPRSATGTVRWREPDGARTVLPHVRHEAEGVSGGYLEAPRPALDDQLVVREQSPQVRIDLRVPVLDQGERHRQRDGIGLGGEPPAIGVFERKPSPAIAPQPPDLGVAEERDELARHCRGLRAARTTASMSGTAVMAAERALGFVSAVARRTPSTSRVRRMRPSSIRGFPASASMIH